MRTVYLDYEKIHMKSQAPFSFGKNTDIEKKCFKIIKFTVQNDQHKTLKPITNVTKAKGK